MKTSRPSRFLAALLTIFSLLFAQLAVAAYACPNSTTAPIAASASQSDMPGCTGMDHDQPGLCKVHCDKNHQTIDTPAAPHVSPFVASTLVYILSDSGPTSPIFAHNGASLLQHTTSPPIAIRNCCFRI